MPLSCVYFKFMHTPQKSKLTRESFDSPDMRTPARLLEDISRKLFDEDYPHSEDHHSQDEEVSSPAPRLSLQRLPSSPGTHYLNITRQSTTIEGLVNNSGIGSIKIELDDNMKSVLMYELNDAPLKALSLVRSHERKPFSVLAVVIRKDSRGWKITDLCSSGSSERTLVLTREAKDVQLESSQVIIILKAETLGSIINVTGSKCVYILGQCEDLDICAKDKCHKPIRTNRDGPMCWQHTFDASIAKNGVRANIKGGVLEASKSAVQVTDQLPGADLKPELKIKSEADKKRKAYEDLQARKRAVIYLQERKQNNADNIHAFSYSRLNGTNSVVAGKVEWQLGKRSEDDGLEIELDDEASIRIPTVRKRQQENVEIRLIADELSKPAKKAPKKEANDRPDYFVPPDQKEKIISMPSMFGHILKDVNN